MVNLTARRCHDIAIIECKNYRKVRKIDVEKLSRIYKKVSKPCYLVVPTETGNFVYCVKREIVWGSDIEEVFK